MFEHPDRSARANGYDWIHVQAMGGTGYVALEYTKP